MQLITQLAQFTWFIVSKLGDFRLKTTQVSRTMVRPLLVQIILKQESQAHTLQGYKIQAFLVSFHRLPI